MRVLILIDRTMQHAGSERVLHRGEVHELSDVIAQAFIATGAAERADVAVRRAPEAKPALARETKVAR